MTDSEGTTAAETHPIAETHSIKAEEWLIGGILLDESTWPDAADGVSAEDFHHPPHGLVFRVVAEMVDSGRSVDLVTVTEELSDRALLEGAGGPDYLAALVERMARKPGRPNIAAYARIIRDRATLRGLIDVGTAIAESALREQGRGVEALLDDAERRVLLLRGNRRPARKVRRAAEVAEHLQDMLQRQASVATGLQDLDAITGGFAPAELVVIGGRPGMGKSTLLANIAEHAVITDTKDSRAVLFFSLDRPAEAVTCRLLASLGKIDLHLLRGGVPSHETERLATALGTLRNKPLYLEDGPLTAGDIRLRARQVVRDAGPLKLILVDALQPLQQMLPTTDRELQPRDDIEPSWSLKTLAREMQCPVVATSALSRRPERRGTTDARC